MQHLCCLKVPPLSAKLLKNISTLPHSSLHIQHIQINMLYTQGLFKSLGRSRRTSARSASDGSGRRLAFAGRLARRAQSITPRLARFSFLESGNMCFSNEVKLETCFQFVLPWPGPNPLALPSWPEQVVSPNAIHSYAQMIVMLTQTDQNKL